MQILTHASLAFAAALFSPSLPTAADGAQAPPSMVLIPGGRTKVGTAPKDMVKLIEEHAEAQEKAGGCLAETPQHTVTVDDFYLMVTEVTSEQFREYVQATGARPPYMWGDKAINAAIQARTEAYGKAVEEAKAAGRPAPDRPGKFDRAYWWEQNWKGAEWEMPESLAKKPVVYVDYQDAKGYAEWAGLRLMTEFEFERAARGDSGRTFTWGDDWKKGLCATKELKLSDCVDVGKYSEGATEQGVHDLNGNVWEWTSSPYVAYPGWKHEKFNVGKGSLKREINAMPKWSPDRRVVRSGSSQTGLVFARNTTRGGFDRYQQASVLGFRCAASIKPGMDFAQEAMSQIPNEIRPQDSKGPVTFMPVEVIAMDRWMSTDGASEVPGYGVITGYDYILFTPTEEIQANGVGDLQKASQSDELTYVGFLSTNKDMVEPALRAGTYLVAIRGAGKYPERKIAAEGAEPVEAGAKEEDPDGATKVMVDNFLELDPEIDNYVFIDMTGTPVAAMPTKKLEYGNNSSATKLGAFVVDKTVTIEIPGKKEGEVEEIEVEQQWLDLKYFVKGRSRKGLKATLSLRFEEGLLDGDWRRGK